MGGAALLMILLLIADLKAPPPREPDALPTVAEFMHMRAQDVARIELKRKSGNVTLVRRGDSWSFEQPGRFRADSEEVNNWLKSILDDSTVNRDVGASAADPARYGLHQPETELVLTGRSGEVRRLQFGGGFKAAAGETPSIFYARELSDNRLFMLSTAQIDAIRDRGIEELRDRRLLPVTDEKRVRRISLQQGDRTLTVEKRGDNWHMTEPFDAPADSLSVETWLSSIRSARADRFEPGGRIDPARPSGRLTLVDAAGEHQLLLGSRKGDQTYAVRLGDEEVKLVSSTTLSSITKTGSDLRDRKLITLESDKIRLIDLKNRHGAFLLQRQGDGWTMDGEKQPVKSDQVQLLLNSITGQATAHVEERPADLRKYGLDEPEISARVNDGSGSSQVLRIGKRAADGSRYAAGVATAVFRIPEFAYNDLNVRRAALLQSDDKK